MKKYFIFAASALALASCSSDDYLGNNPGNENGASNAINFAGGTGKTTRADRATSAELLNKSFVVYGYKTTGGEKSTVYDHYTVNYVENSNPAEGNTQGWKYVGLTPNSLSTLQAGSEQTIKYWDYSASQYDFVAFSFGKGAQGDADNQVKATAVQITDKADPEVKAPYYTLTGNATELTKCYIADRVTAEPKTTDKKNTRLVAYQDDVKFNFRSLGTKVTIGIYEIIPGYSVKDVKFYKNDTEEAQAPTLYTNDKKIPSGKGTVTVNFPTTSKDNTDYNKAHVSFAPTDANADMASSISFDELSVVEKEKNEKNSTEFIGRDITNVSTTYDNQKKKTYKDVIPAHVGALTLKVDYTLESIDGSGEEIKVTGATATIPAEYTNWEPNYAYTYIFKISDKTNGNTGTTDDPAGLYPISFDAIVTETEAGLQNTITIVDDNSITTYAKGEQNNEYKAGYNIYVSISGQTLATDNTALYTAALNDVSKGNISESLVALCLKGTATGASNNTWTLDNNGNTLTVTKANAPEIVQEIEAADAADGNAISGNFAKFKPATAGNYVFEYTYTAGEETKKAYKVIKVVE